MPRKLSIILEGAAAALLCLVMAVCVCDVVLRYFLNAPLLWSFDLITIYLLSGIYFFALTSTDDHGDHIAVDFFYLVFPTHIRRVISFVADLIVFVAVAIMTIGIFDRLLDAIQFGDMFNSAIVAPVWTSLIAPPIGLLAYCLLLAHRLITLRSAYHADQPHAAASRGEEKP
ncbi:MAG TPA: TRAP transporter small permease [Ferrovibrio sp.]|uniref:TRAP transporter small permease n=1 Tax=Ferrovibrio sp. TaxID=1917215 RepID=UPI002B4B35A9|nr:TRAP transporter small permease [Ferrovibrio sp.]HLT79254.1 TRAP transporter small permease [Ferrovibrio sp.]